MDLDIFSIKFCHRCRNQKQSIIECLFLICWPFEWKSVVMHIWLILWQSLVSWYQFLVFVIVGSVTKEQFLIEITHDWQNIFMLFRHMEQSVKCVEGVDGSSTLQSCTLSYYLSTHAKYNFIRIRIQLNWYIHSTYYIFFLDLVLRGKDFLLGM